MSGHTPGPWEAHYENPDFVEVCESASGKLFLLASVQRQWRGPGKSDPDDATTRANARMMAAAPELAEAGHALAWLAIQSERYAEDHEYREAVDHMFAVLAKTRGVDRGTDQ